MLDTIKDIIQYISQYHESLVVSFILAILAGLTAVKTIPRLKQPFLNAKLSGIDILKPNKPILPETLGLPIAIIYLITMFLFIPVPFIDWFGGKFFFSVVHDEAPHLGTFPYHKLGEILSAILAIQSMVLLGFADDVLDVRWRYKVWFPAIAGIPLLIFYYTNFGVTYVVTPIQLRPWFGDMIHLGPLYYVYMLSLIIFCTHSINILAGINGIEAGQTLVISLSIIINDLLYIYKNPDQRSVEVHLFSLYFMLPFTGVTLALLYYNWYPAKVFVGDTFCYFAGMTIAVVGILGHFPKTLVLFFIPQMFNFLYSCPQLFRFVECPRHRMPRVLVDNKNDQSKVLLHCSVVTLNQERKPTGKLGRAMLEFLNVLGLLHVISRDDHGRISQCNNLTLLNLVLSYTGPIPENRLTCTVLLIQILCSLLAFYIRYSLVKFVY
ncbi:glycosyl transferase family 4-domain-containing protein [Halteromyces radiatus]|uniref:glycosyl transferase family 4-domain-containing protein n=1 Tax=Halteromyces radiatus TaxID=101107 RepID=UPI00221EEC3A|nr:glycosyl transferase family 4-domain-containing protein [Halteromyces radiatus]KAI8099271.1 glycosyl transferase family 4-domain-containing protein [Halteromyces radiatus]